MPASPTTTNVSEWFLAWSSVIMVSVPAGRWKVKPKGNSKNFNQ
jgi:hypothetical protein